MDAAVGAWKGASTGHSVRGKPCEERTGILHPNLSAQKAGKERGGTNLGWGTLYPGCLRAIPTAL